MTIRKLGIDGETYDALMVEARCAACGATEGQVRNGKPSRLAIDHDHATGRIRGILCHSCNLALANANDDPAILRGLIVYLDTCF
jgi:hypothetical protein